MTLAIPYIQYTTFRKKYETHQKLSPFQCCFRVGRSTSSSFALRSTFKLGKRGRNNGGGGEMIFPLFLVLALFLASLDIFCGRLYIGKFTYETAYKSEKKLNLNLCGVWFSLIFLAC